MYRGKSIAVIVPCLDEEKQLPGVLATMPAEADRVLVVDDGSTDRTAEKARCFAEHDRRIAVLRHRERRGVGAALVTGYRAAMNDGMDIAVVMAGDGQMAPSDFLRIAGPVARGQCDYCKGERMSGKCAGRIPVLRRLGIRILSRLTGRLAKIPGLKDSQCGYTALDLRMAARLDLDSVYPAYGYPNDLLIRLAAAGARIREVPVMALYGVGEQSGLRPFKVMLPIAGILLRAVLNRGPKGQSLCNLNRGCPSLLIQPKQIR